MKHQKSTLAAKASRALGWNFVNTVLSRLGTLGISIMLARLLGPHVFGAYAVALVALYAMQTFNELGMSLAIVRWETDPRDIIPTITTVSVAVSVIIYAGCFWIAPAYASAMGAPAATGVVQVLALAILIDGFCNTPAGLLQRRFQQGKATIATQVGSWTGTGVTVALAWSHHGAMSLAIGQVTGSLVVAIFLIAFAPESLRFGFDPARARALLRFGLPLSGSSLISFAVMSVDQIIVGHMLGPTSLAFYVLAFNLSSWPYNMFLGPVRNVAPAVFSRLQHDQPTMRGTFLSAARILTAVTLPICLLIGGSATALIGFVYGARWLPAAQPLIWLAVAGGARIFLQLAYDYVVVLGWTRLLLLIQLVWLIALIPCLIGATRADGIYGAGLAEAAVALLVVVPCYLAVLRKAGIGLMALGKSLLLPLTAAAAAGLAAIGADMLMPSNLMALAVSGVITTALIGLIAYRMRSTFAELKRMTGAPQPLPVQPLESVVQIREGVMDQGDDGDVQQATHVEQDVDTALRDLAVVHRPAAGAERPQDPGPSRAPSHRVQAVIGDIPREPPGFQPRAELLAELDRARDGVSVIHPVAGMCGVGATQLAAAYARAKLAEGWRLVVWVEAHDTGSLMTGLAVAAEAPELAASEIWRDTADAGRVVRLRLEADGDRCLLVFNDAEDLDVLRPFIPVGGTARVLVTSTRPPEADLASSIPVGLFSADEAVTFLARRTGLADEAGAAAVAAELGHLPLALALAAAVIAGQNMGYGAYLDWLRATPARGTTIQEEGQPSSRGLADAVLLSLEAIRTADKTGLCTRVMETMAVLSTVGVRRELLLTPGQRGELIIGKHRATAALVDRALAQLAERSLLTCSLDGRTVVAHRLVTRMVRDEIARDKRLTAVGRTAAAMLEAHAQSLDSSRDRLAARDITEQVTALDENTAATAGETDEELTRALLRLRFLAQYHLVDLGDSPTQAVAFSERLTADLGRALGPDHPSTLNSRNSLAAAYRAAGRADEAMQLFQQTLLKRMRLLGAEHPDTQTSQNNLAAAYHDVGRMAEAILLYELTLAARERLLGASHPSTLNSRGNLAAAYQDAGRIDDAIPLFEQILASRDRVLGADHPDTVNSRNNLANAYRDAGRSAEAVPLFEQSLADCERLRGVDNAETLALWVNLAAAYRDTERATEAIPLMEQVLATRERLLGTDHAKTLAARNNLAAVYLDAGRIADAIPLFEQTLAVREQLVGTDHPSTLASRNNLANAYRDAGRADEAIALHEQTLAACERLLGGDHPSTLASRNNLANAYRDAGRAEEAIHLFEQTLADRERLPGTDHPGSRTTQSNLALAYQEE
jgi:O-antigen/teichoic acid export membrane protein/tetratricopeptide (TPR) repeat protein